jgi:hypothetical protein
LKAEREILYEPVEIEAEAPPESISPSGLHIVSFSGLYGELHCWVKMRGEPAQILWCKPREFEDVWREYAALNDPSATLAACDFNSGLPCFYFHHIISELVYVGVTHKPKESAKPAPGGIWMPDWKGPKSGVWIQK